MAKLSVSLILSVLVYSLTSCSTAGMSSETAPINELAEDSIESIEVASTVTSSVMITPSSILVQTTSQPAIETELPTAEPTTNPGETSTPSATLEPGSSLIANTHNYMLMTSNNILWHPDNPRPTKPFNHMVFSDQPWSPDGSQLATIVRTEETPRQNKLALVTLETGKITFLNATEFQDSELADASQLWAPYWSSNGQFLLYSIYQEESDGFIIAVYDLISEKEVFISSSINLIDLSGWSFDSTEIAYVHWSDDTSNPETILTLADIVNERIKHLNIANIARARWSPTAKALVAFTSQISLDDNQSLPIYSYDEILFVDADSQRVELLKGFSTRDSYSNGGNSGGYHVNGMPWSSNGQGIIYSDKGIICSFMIDTGLETCLPEIEKAIEETGAIGGEYPSWSSSGEMVGFILKFANQQCNPIATITLNGEILNSTDATLGDCSLFGPIWSRAPNQ